jgi:hypothetical protein
VLVDLSRTTAPLLTITNAATGAPIAFTPVLSAADTLTVVAFGAATGTVQFAALSDRFEPAASSAGLRFFNGVASTGPLLMQRDGLLTPFVPFGRASSFASVTIDSATVTVADEFSNVLDAGPLAFTLGRARRSWWARPPLAPSLFVSLPCGAADSAESSEREIAPAVVSRVMANAS